MRHGIFLYIGIMVGMAFTAHAENAPSAPLENSENTDSIYRSIMFSKDELEQLKPLQQAFAIFNQARLRGENVARPTEPEEAVPLPVKGDGAATATAAPQTYTYPQFFLSSLVYYHPQKWTVWVNGERITQDSPKEDAALIVSAITQHSVTFLWKVDSKEAVNWAKPHNPHVSLNAAAHTITFTLTPNQTFSSYSLDILEGKVQPVEVPVNQVVRNDKPAQPNIDAIPKSPSPVVMPILPNPNSSGINGLINRYQQLDKPKE